MTRDRRERLLVFIMPWADCQPRYKVSIGHQWVSINVLTDEALEKLASVIRDDFWRERRLNRLNRPFYATANGWKPA